MANEKRLIDANALLNWLEECTDENDWLVSQYNADWIWSMIDSTPTVDAVEVVRCKDCKHYYHSAYAMRCVCDLDNKVWDKDDFCSCGEKREV